MLVRYTLFLGSLGAKTITQLALIKDVIQESQWSLQERHVTLPIWPECPISIYLILPVYQ